MFVFAEKGLPNKDTFRGSLNARATGNIKKSGKFLNY
jgi:hypothetical protein